MSVTVSGKSVDLRVATLPTVYGEKVVMRILDKGQALLTPRRPGLPARRARAVRGVVPQAVRHDPRDRPDRFREVDDALRDAQHPQRRRPQHHHGRGPGRVPAARHQPDADQPQGRAHLRRRAALDPACRFNLRGHHTLPMVTAHLIFLTSAGIIRFLWLPLVQFFNLHGHHTLPIVTAHPIFRPQRASYASYGYRLSNFSTSTGIS